MRQVDYARLHQAFFCPETGNLEATLSTNKYTGMTMFWTSEGLEVHYKGVHFIVPLANIQGCKFATVKPALKQVK